VATLGLALWDNAPRANSRELTANFTNLAIFASGLALAPTASDGSFWLTFVALLLAHDAYFYFCHRLLHTPWLMRRVHSLHHGAKRPTPWNALLIHPFEALLDAAFIPLAALTIPCNSAALALFFVLMLLCNLVGHRGIESVPVCVWPLWLAREEHHRNHHLHGTGNFGAYTRFWDWFWNTAIKS
jgi:sterol desaturase/sphingolipid hydroxylase (fatty acid hydroxylase superfamily)